MFWMCFLVFLVSESLIIFFYFFRESIKLSFVCRIVVPIPRFGEGFFFRDFVSYFFRQTLIAGIDCFHWDVFNDFRCDLLESVNGSVYAFYSEIISIDVEYPVIGRCLVVLVV